MSYDDDRELEALLRGDGERLNAPPELWDTIRGRARRRKLMKGTLAAAGVVVVIAGAVPAVIAVRDNAAGNGKVNVSTSPKREQPNIGGPTSVARPTSLAALSPETVSFVSQDQGWVSGPLNVDGGQIGGGLGETTTGGSSWAPVGSNPAPTGLVRMATPTLGFSFGASYQETTDGGKTWRSLPSPGYIEDLETNSDGRQLWALVRSCVTCSNPRLFTATQANPQLHPALGVPPIDSYDAALTLAGPEVYVSGGQMLLRSIDGGLHWRTLSNPCGEGDQAFAAWEQGGLAAECTPVRGKGSVFESHDGGVHWTNIANTPVGVRAGVATLAAGISDDLVITTGVGPPYVSTDAGYTWTKASIPGAGPVTFAAFISDSHVVGLSAGATPGFVSSSDAGRTWTVTRFAN